MHTSTHTLRKSEQDTQKMRHNVIDINYKTGTPHTDTRLHTYVLTNTQIKRYRPIHRNTEKYINTHPYTQRHTHIHIREKERESERQTKNDTQTYRNEDTDKETNTYKRSTEISNLRHTDRHADTQTNKQRKRHRHTYTQNCRNKQTDEATLRHSFTHQCKQRGIYTQRH